MKGEKNPGRFARVTQTFEDSFFGGEGKTENERRNKSPDSCSDSETIPIHERFHF